LGGHLTPGPTGSTPPNGGISFENWAGASKQKLLLAVGLQSKILFLRVHLTSGPTHSKGGICSSLFRSLETCPSRSCFIFKRSTATANAYVRYHNNDKLFLSVWTDTFYFRCHKEHCCCSLSSCRSRLWSRSVNYFKSFSIQS
jgi:hypothetical protein